MNNMYDIRKTSKNKKNNIIKRYHSPPQTSLNSAARLQAGPLLFLGCSNRLASEDAQVRAAALASDSAMELMKC